MALVLFLCKNINAQNLISNSSFESSINNDCYGSFDHHIFPNPHILNNWYNFNSPDYFSSVCTGWYNIPNSYFGYSFSKQGDSHVGIYIYKNGSENKEYIYQQLSSPLQSGKLYCLSFYVSRADRIPFAVKNMGAYFSNTLPSLIGGEYINAIPQVENQNTFLTDTTGWIQIQGCFTALGGEQFITIGNFHDNASTDTLRIQSTNPLTGTGTDVAYYYIDDLTLIDQTTVGVKEEVSFLNGVVGVNPNPANEILNFTFASEKQGRKIELYDAIGNLVITEEANSNNLSLTTDNLSNGVYFYRILVGEKVIKTDKIVIIK